MTNPPVPTSGPLSEGPDYNNIDPNSPYGKWKAGLIDDAEYAKENAIVSDIATPENLTMYYGTSLGAANGNVSVAVVGFKAKLLQWSQQGLVSLIDPRVIAFVDALPSVSFPTVPQPNGVDPYYLPNVAADLEAQNAAYDAAVVAAQNASAAASLPPMASSASSAPLTLSGETGSISASSTSSVSIPSTAPTFAPVGPSPASPGTHVEVPIVAAQAIVAAAKAGDTESLLHKILSLFGHLF